ncbi:hypothetical protein EJK15_23775 [Nonomuraea basaltis]|nr:hypothetical protein EJK15_23775 [Nonomuraea basaltis]
MPDSTVADDNELYPSGDVACRTGLSVSAMRFYSDAGQCGLQHEPLTWGINLHTAKDRARKIADALGEIVKEGLEPKGRMTREMRARRERWCRPANGP